MLDQLHSEIDRIEPTRQKAKDAADVGRIALRNALEAGANPRQAMEMAAHVVDDELTDLTTEAFRLGVGFAKERRNASGDAQAND